jgi:hypothetical protein
MQPNFHCQNLKNGFHHLFQRPGSPLNSASAITRRIVGNVIGSPMQAGVGPLLESGCFEREVAGRIVQKAEVAVALKITGKGPLACLHVVRPIQDLWP